MAYDYLERLHPEQGPFTPEERGEFRQMLKDRPNLKKLYRDFKTPEYQKIRSRIGGGLWTDDKLDALFEIAVISGV